MKEMNIIEETLDNIDRMKKEMWLWRCKQCDAVIDRVPCPVCKYTSRYQNRRDE